MATATRPICLSYPVHRRGDALFVDITDQGGDVPTADAETPDLLAKLSGEQSGHAAGASF